MHTSHKPISYQAEAVTKPREQNRQVFMSTVLSLLRTQISVPFPHPFYDGFHKMDMVISK